MKLDFKKQPPYRARATGFADIEVPPQRYLAIDGHGDPNTAEAYRLAVEALYSTAYGAKFGARERTGEDFVVGPLEGLWYAEDPSVYVTREKAAWSWTMMLPLPPWVDDTDIDAGRAGARAKRPDLPVEALTVRTLAEGRCLQILHIGSYDDEGPTLRRLHEEVLPAAGLVPAGEHHEIYLSDPRRTESAKLRTVLRQPVRPR